jgi:hypothetical protein
MKRLFTFGCSFTNYGWPTWADIVSQDYDCYENWGKGGGGNKFIHSSLIECHQRNNITADDTVMVMWSSQAREDRFLRGKWHTKGSVYNSDYSQEFIEKFTDTTGYLLDTVTYMQSSYHILNAIGCEKHFFSMLPMSIGDDTDYWLTGLIKKLTPTVSDNILKLYAPVLKFTKPSVHKTVFNSDWHSRDDKIIPQALNASREIFSKQYNKVAGSDWPTFDNFFDSKIDDIEPHIMEEIDKQFNFVHWRDDIKYRRHDPHPTPIEHLEYLDCVKFPVSIKARDFAKHWEDQVMADTNTWKIVKAQGRF